MLKSPVFEDVLDAAARIAGHCLVTPVLRCDALDQLTGAELWFKSEHLQHGGAFKFRGACNAVLALDPDRARRGVVTQSSGNHGAALARACSAMGLTASVVVPRDASPVKLAAMREHGARIVLCEPGQDHRDAATARLLADGGVLVHPYDDPQVIAGQGTVALELLRQVPDLDAIVAPVSGGGLLSGIAIATHAMHPALSVLGVEPEGADDARRSLAQGQRVTDLVPDTICDGLRARLSERTFAILRHHCEAILVASDDQTRAAMTLIATHLKQVVEPSAAVTLAAILRNRARFAGRRVGVVLSGGNVTPGAA